MKPGHAVHEAIDALGRGWVHHTTVHDAHHAVERPCRVDGQEDVVGHDKGVEEAGLADGPWLLAVGSVVSVQELCSDSVEGGDGYGHLGVEGGPVEVVRYQDWRGRGHGAREGRGQEWRLAARGEHAGEEGRVGSGHMHLI